MTAAGGPPSRLAFALRRYGGHPSRVRDVSSLVEKNLRRRLRAKVGLPPVARSGFRRAKGGGPDRDRTGDLMNAIHARSQLRYWPTRGGERTSILPRGSAE